jgi:DNA/RNA-binding domain of Phe-tRNA-synthetase-like protein
LRFALYFCIALGMTTQSSDSNLSVEQHPLLDVGAFVSEFPRPLGEIAVDVVQAAVADHALEPRFAASDAVRAAVRDLLRQGGFKPTGRSKPASEYLLRAASEGPLPAINAAVDLCNHVSLHSGLPISVADLDRATAPLSIRVAPVGAAYVFNASGQTIDLGGLLCLCDAAGPCANAVKDAQRTKTNAATRRTLSIVWGTNRLAGNTAAVTAWYERLVTAAGGTTIAVNYDRR